MTARITAIKLQRRHPNRVNIFLDGEFAFGLDGRVAIEAGLSVGDELDATVIARLQSGDEVSKATDSALRLLASRPRAIQELRTRLHRDRGYDEPVIDQVIDRLASWGYVDDEAFAEFWVDNRETHRPRGRRLIEQELRHKGVDREVVRATLDAAEIDESEGAERIARDKLRSYRDLPPEVVKRRLGGYLARRGYGYEVVGPILKRLLEEEPSVDD